MSHAFLRSSASSVNQFCTKMPMNEKQARRVANGRGGYVKGKFDPTGVMMQTKGLHAYTCDRCGYWHVGHKPGTSPRYL